MRALLAVWTLAVASACDQSTTGPGPSTRAEHSTASFTFHYDSSVQPSIPAIADFAESRVGQIQSDLGVSQMPRVSVTYHRDHAALAEAVRPLVGAIPSFASGLVTSATAIHAVAPSSGTTVAQAGTLVVHEFGHCVTLRINGQSANNPRWLWESVALFEAREFVEPRALSYLAAGGQPPTLAELNSFNDMRIYQVGYLLGEFIVHRGGLAALRQLIDSRGDTAAVLALDTAAFEREWVRFVRERYLS